MRQIPHLNKLQEKYGKKGLTIVGVTNEPASRIEPFIDDKGIEYVIAIGGGDGYSTRGIPHAWLVSPKGEIVWKGHPASLKDAQIEEQLKGVTLKPTFKLPNALKRAQKSLNAGKYTSGLKVLESYLKKPKDDDVAAAARDAIKKVTEYGESQYKNAEQYAEEGYYGDAMNIMAMLEKAFKGREIGDKAKKQRSTWKKDPKIKTELAAAAYVDKARQLVRAKKYKAAYPLLLRVIKSKKYTDTKAREQAVKLQKSIRKHI